jgi:hypothetical protein
VHSNKTLILILILIHCAALSTQSFQPGHLTEVGFFAHRVLSGPVRRRRAHARTRAQPPRAAGRVSRCRHHSAVAPFKRASCASLRQTAGKHSLASLNARCICQGVGMCWHLQERSAAPVGVFRRTLPRAVAARVAAAQPERRRKSRAFLKTRYETQFQGCSGLSSRCNSYADSLH